MLYNSIDDFYLDASLGGEFAWRIAENQKTLGMLYDLKYVKQAYQGIINILDEIIAKCRSVSPTYYTMQAILHLNNAKNLVISCREEVNEVHQKDVYQYSYQEVKSPMLKRISYDDRSIEFKYEDQFSESFLLSRVIVRDGNNDTIKSVKLNRDYWLVPKKISFLDKCDKEISDISFEYYGLISGLFVTNVYGYYAIYEGNRESAARDIEYQNKRRFFPYNDANAKCGTLKAIKISNDAQIELDYESNTCNLSSNDDWEWYWSQYHMFGGIRISNIQVKDLLSGKTDKISYYYENYGTCVYSKLSNKIIVNYSAGFCDALCFDRLMNQGPDVYVKHGNNGIYYSRVNEYFEGKGRVSHSFIMPDTSGPSYNYWNIGKPLGTCYYNLSGHLRKVIRYEYDDQLALANRKHLSQIKACEYFVDAQKIERRYGDSLYFEDNMRERLYPELPADQSYRIAYNYSVYLKRISEYDFENALGASQTDYLRESPNFKRTEYNYDLSRSTFPVKTTVTGSDGLKRVTTVKRALDFDNDADVSIPLLKARNMVGLPLKVQTKVVDPNGVGRLLSERVNEYKRHETYNDMVLTGTHEYVYDGTAVEKTDSLFGFDRAEYDRTTFGYTCDYRDLPVSVENRGECALFLYDFTTGNAVLQASLVPENSVAACDYRRFRASGVRPEFKLQNAPPVKYRLFVVAGLTTAGEVSLTVNKSSGSTVQRFTLRPNHLGPQVFDVDLTGASGTGAISLSGSSGNLLYIALVPADGEFEATSYNADGTVFCRFDHGGLMERYEYDGAGRVIKVFDRDGNLLKENSYNVVVQ